MFGNAKMAAIERRQAVVEMTLAVVVAERMSHARPDLRKPREIRLVDVADLRVGALREGLDKLFSRHFSICLFDELVELAQVYVQEDLRMLLRPLHCRDWANMEPEFRERIQDHILAVFVPVENGGDS